MSLGFHSGSDKDHRMRYQQLQWRTKLATFSLRSLAVLENRSLSRFEREGKLGVGMQARFRVVMPKWEYLHHRTAA